MNIVKRIISVISTIMCITILWIPIHFGLKTLMYGDKRESKNSSSKAKVQTEKS